MSWFAPNYRKNVVEPAVLGESVHLSTGGQVPRDYTSVVDLATLVSAVLQAPEDADRVFYAATGRALSTAADVCSVVRELIPGADIAIGDEWTKEDLAELPIRGQYSIENAARDLGWTPRFAELRDGIVDYIERFRAFLAEGGIPTPMPPGLGGAPGQAGS